MSEQGEKGLVEWCWYPDGMNELICVDDETGKPTRPTYFLCADVDPLLAAKDAEIAESAEIIKLGDELVRERDRIAFEMAEQAEKDQRRIAELEAELATAKGLIETEEGR